jgi:hypothetical protein
MEGAAAHTAAPFVLSMAFVTRLLETIEHRTKGCIS